MTVETASDDVVYLTTREVSKLTGFAEPTLMSWRSRGDGGPPFHRVGKRGIRYKKSEVIAWMERHRCVPAYMQIANEALPPAKAGDQPRPWE